MRRDTDFNYGHNTDTGSIADSMDCAGDVICNRCGRRHGACDELKDKLTYKGGSNVNIGQHLKAGGRGSDFNPIIQPRDVSKKGSRFKVLAVREVNSPPRKATKDKPASQGFNGLFIDLKNGTKKYALPVRYDRFDLDNIVAQMKSEDTDDWIGRDLKLIAVKGKKGGTFVNVAKK